MSYTMDDSHASYHSLNDNPTNKKSVNQSINQSNKQSVRQSINQSHSQPINQSINQSDDDADPSELIASSSTDSILHQEAVSVIHPSMHQSIIQSINQNGASDFGSGKSFKQSINQSVNRLSCYFPIIKWLPLYNVRVDLLGDLLAGLSVGLMLVPQSMAYAQICDLSIMTGLFTGMIGTFVYTAFGTSRDLSIGPTSVLSLLVLSSYVGDQSMSLQERSEQAFLFAFFAGFFQLALGLCQLGFLLDFISHPIISGFTSASALTIASVQMKNLTGIKVSDTFMKNIYYLCKNVGMLQWHDTILGIICICFLSCLARWKSVRREDRFFLWFLCTARNAFIVFLATGVTSIISFCGYEWWKTVPKISEGDALLPTFSTTFFQSINQSNLVSFVTSGFVIAAVSILEGIAVAKSFAKQNGYELRMSQELIASGICMSFGSFFGAYPQGGSFSRTAVNSAAGSRTPLAGVFAGTCVILSLLFASPLFHYIPESALAAVIMTAVLSMVDFDYMIILYRMGEPDQLPINRSTNCQTKCQSITNYLIDWILVVIFGPIFVPFCLYFRSSRSPAPQAWWDLLTLVIAFWGCLAINIEMGIFLSVLLSLAITFYRASIPAVIQLQPTNQSINQDENQPLLVKRFKDQVLCVRIDGNIMFYSINSILAGIRSIECKYYSTDQSIRRPIKRAIKQSINRSVDQSTADGLDLSSDEQKYVADQSVNRSIDPVMDASNDTSIDMLHHQSINQSINQSLNESDNHNGLIRSTSEENRLRSLENHLEDLSLLHHSNQSINQSVNQSINQSIHQSINQSPSSHLFSRLGCLILDFVSVSEIDTSGVDGLVSMIRDLDDVIVLLVHCKPVVRRFLLTALAATKPKIWEGEIEEHFFPSMSEANAYAAKLIN